MRVVKLIGSKKVRIKTIQYR